MITFSVQTVHRVVCWVTFAQEAIFGDKHKNIAPKRHLQQQKLA